MDKTDLHIVKEENWNCRSGKMFSRCLNGGKDRR